MHRLFSLFPEGGPGAGLVLLRLAVSAYLVLHNPVLALGGSIGAGNFATAAIALLLLLGLFTPWLAIACCLGAIIELYHAEFGRTVLSPLAFGLSSAALMLLGPGAYSADALLFGRRVVKIPD